MVKSASSAPGLADTLERVIPAGRESLSPGWHGRVSELGSVALQGFWAEAVAYARWEIGCYARWRKLEEPVLADGYDGEGVVQAAFERLMSRDRGSVPILYSAEEIRRELRRLIKHRVRWLHERSETQLVVSEWDVLLPKPEAEQGSIFERLPGKIARPDEELMQKEKEQLLGEFKAGFERTLPAKDLREVFQRGWDGQKRQEAARQMGATVERVKALQAQVKRRLLRYGMGAREGVSELVN